MRLFKRISLYIKNIFVKKEETKELLEPKFVINENKTESFFDSLKKATIERKSMKQIETLICEGDGLGIKHNITY